MATFFLLPRHHHVWLGHEYVTCAYWHCSRAYMLSATCFSMQDKTHQIDSLPAPAPLACRRRQRVGFKLFEWQRRKHAQKPLLLPRQSCRSALESGPKTINAAPRRAHLQAPLASKADPRQPSAADMPAGDLW